MKIFIDVDNTILEHSGFYSSKTEGRIHSSIGKYPLENKKAIETMYESSVCRDPYIIRELLKLDNVYILTKYSVLEYEEHKRNRLAEILQISVEELMNLKDKNNYNKYICLNLEKSKVDCVKEIFDIDEINNYILVDDYSHNIIEWENAGGVGIKYYNEFNNPNHPTSGLSISSFKFFEYFLKGSNVSNLLLSSDNKYQIELFINSFKKTKDVLKINILYEVYNEIVEKLSINKFENNNKYDYFNFIIEYYYFRHNIDNTYWRNYFKKLINLDIFNVIIADFDIDFKMYNIFEDKESVSMKIIDSNKFISNNTYDIYVTLEENVFITDTYMSYDKIISTLSKFLLENKKEN